MWKPQISCCVCSSWHPGQQLWDLYINLGWHNEGILKLTGRIGSVWSHDCDNTSKYYCNIVTIFGWSDLPAFSVSRGASTDEGIDSRDQYCLFILFSIFKQKVFICYFISIWNSVFKFNVYIVHICSDLVYISCLASLNTDKSNIRCVPCLTVSGIITVCALSQIPLIASIDCVWALPQQSLVLCNTIAPSNNSDLPLPCLFLDHMKNTSSSETKLSLKHRMWPVFWKEAPIFINYPSCLMYVSDKSCHDDH